MLVPVLIIVGLVGLYLFSGSQTVSATVTNFLSGNSGNDPGFPNMNAQKIPAQTIVQVAQNAGFSGDDLTIAVAVAMAESGGDANAYNPEVKAGTPEGQGSYGLWQIYLKVHPEFKGQNLYDPQTNANAAFSVYSAAGSNFNPWSTFNPRDGSTPRYLVYLDQAGAAVNA